ncbi:hypothetical protein LUZ60_008576 [Juncus effusus]|nr:hypothetical protein LUZ60_008576 [Juncus effusus]
MAAQSSAAPELPTPPPTGPSKGFLRRIFPLLLTVNLAVGVYVLTRTSQNPKKKEEQEDSQIAEKSSENKIPQTTPPVPAPVKKELPPITAEEKLELCKWILQEKRKIKTKDPVEKKKIDEEKALLKEMIKSKNIPNL